jgi:hypothetical protein
MDDLTGEMMILKEEIWRCRLYARTFFQPLRLR